MKIEIKKRKDPMEEAMNGLIDEADEIEGEGAMHRVAADDPEKKPPEAPGHTDIVIDIKGKPEEDETNEHAEPDADQKGGPSDNDADNEDDDEEFWQAFGKNKPSKK